jgi:uncharacterized membrane protein
VFGGIVWILFWVSVVYLLVQAIFRPGRHEDHTSDALEIARERLARGEITPQEYDEIVRHLRTRSAIRDRPATTVVPLRSALTSR